MRYPFIATYVLSALLLLLSACANNVEHASVLQEGDILFTEFMQTDLINGQSWIELYNRSNTPVTLQQCTLTNQGEQRLVFKQPSVLEPGKHTEIVYSEDEFRVLASDEIALVCGNRSIARVALRIAAPEPSSREQSWQLHYHADSGYDDTQTWCYTTPLEDYQYAGERFATRGKFNSFCASKMPYIAYDDQMAVLIGGIDFEATLKVAEAEFARKTSTSELVIWGIRDQIITPDIAGRISELYFANIEMLYNTKAFTAIDWNHAVWHFAWAISNLYRNGDQSVKKELQLAYEDALTRPDTLARYKYIASDHIRGKQIVMGDTHTPARKRMQQLIVVPGNPEYVNSFEDYLDNQRSAFTLKAMHYAFVTVTFFSNLVK